VGQVNEDYLNNLLEAIEKTHGLKAKYLQTVPIVESFQGKPIWAGEVEVFEVAHPNTTKVYAWGYDENGRSQCVAVLGLDPVKGPQEAVKAYLVAQSRQNSPQK